jgi:hypothetical protein
VGKEPHSYCQPRVLGTSTLAWVPDRPLVLCLIRCLCDRPLLSSEIRVIQQTQKGEHTQNHQHVVKKKEKLHQSSQMRLIRREIACIAVQPPVARRTTRCISHIDSFRTLWQIPTDPASSRTSELVNKSPRKVYTSLLRCTTLSIKTAGRAVKAVDNNTGSSKPDSTRPPFLEGRSGDVTSSCTAS